MFTIDYDIDFSRIRADIEQFAVDHVEYYDGVSYFWEYDIKNFCQKFYPSTASLGIRIFVEFFFHALLVKGIQFTFRRDGIRSCFSGIKLVKNKKPSTKPEDNCYSRRSAQFSNQSIGDIDEDCLDAYALRDTEKKVSVSSLKKIYESAVLDKYKPPFSDFLKRYLAKREWLSLIKEPTSSGKSKRYISGLRLSSKGQSIIDSFDK